MYGDPCVVKASILRQKLGRKVQVCVAITLPNSTTVFYSNLSQELGFVVALPFPSSGLFGSSSSYSPFPVFLRREVYSFFTHGTAPPPRERKLLHESLLACVSLGLTSFIALSFVVGIGEIPLGSACSNGFLRLLKVTLVGLRILKRDTRSSS